MKLIWNHSEVPWGSGMSGIHTQVTLHSRTLVFLKLRNCIAQKSYYYFLLGKIRLSVKRSSKNNLMFSLKIQFEKKKENSLCWEKKQKKTHRVNNTSLFQLNGKNPHLLFLGIRKIKTCVREDTAHFRELIEHKSFTGTLDVYTPWVLYYYVLQTLQHSRTLKSLRGGSIARNLRCGLRSERSDAELNTLLLSGSDHLKSGIKKKSGIDIIL